jgi:fatty acid desaturase
MNENQQGQPVYREVGVNYQHRPVSVGEWMITLLLMAIPLVNIIMLFVWAFSGSTNLSKANWAKATLLWTLIIIIVYAILAILFWGVFMAMMQMN